MVEEVKRPGLQGLISKHLGGDADDDPDGPDIKADRAAKAAVVQPQATRKEAPLAKVAKEVHKLAKQKGKEWSGGQIRALKGAIDEVLKDIVSKHRADNLRDDYAVDSAANSVRSEIRKMVKSLEPPPEMAEADDFQELMELLWPSGMRRKGGSSFNKGSSIRGSIKQEVKQQLVSDSIKEASKRAGKKMMQQMADQNGGLNQFSQMNLDQMARYIKRMLRKKKKGRVDENGEPIVDETSEAEELEATRELQEMMNIFSSRALETMRTIREEIAPKWAPDQQPWLLQEADRQVYDIILAGIPLELFEETEAWDDIQDLRRGQEVFTLRAADKLTEAAARKGSS